MSRADVVAELKADYAENYFISGRGLMRAYEENCTFADPFVSFDGKDRFIKNVSNLGPLLEDVDLVITAFEEGEREIKTSWRFAASIPSLPWNPRLAAAGSTTHVLSDRSGLVVKHIEEWSVDPTKVLLQLVKPGKKPGKNAAAKQSSD